MAGLQLTSTVQLPPGASVGPQWLLCEKSIPEVKMSVILNAVAPLLTRVMTFGELIALTG